LKHFELRGWVPRGLEAPVGPVATAVEGVTCELRLRGGKHDFGQGESPGTEISLRFGLDGAADDQTAWYTAHEIVVRAVNRVLHLVAFAGGNQKRLPVLQFRDFDSIEVVEVGDVERRLEGESPVQRVPWIRRSDQTPRTQELLDMLASRGHAEALWLDALESAFEERPRDAVVAARAAVEVAWREAAESVREAERVHARPRGAAMIEALVDKALADGIPLPQRLHKYSESIFGASFQRRWKAATWNEVRELFSTVRNRGAHGSGSVTENEAHRAVGLARKVLDDIEAVRVAALDGREPPTPHI
jgi:hypothetical protein